MGRAWGTQPPLSLPRIPLSVSSKIAQIYAYVTFNSTEWLFTWLDNCLDGDEQSILGWPVWASVWVASFPGSPLTIFIFRWGEGRAWERSRGLYYILYTLKEGYLGLPSYVKVILKTTPDIQDIWSCPWYSLGHPRLVVPDMVYESIITSRPRSPTCPRTNWDIQGCSQHGPRVSSVPVPRCLVTT